MEYIILGLLLLQSRTIYQLRKRINDGLSLMYSCSTGSIQAAIKKLLKSGYIEVDEIVEGGKQKKLYSITNAGKVQFNLWVNSAIENNGAKNPELAKVYFMGFSEKEARVKLLENYIDNLKNTLSNLERICKDGEELFSRSQENDILFYQLQTAKYGRDLIRFNIDWYNKLLDDIRAN
ncbi:MAG: PadR family transcriptional regulator [Clostridiales bacterium]|nr:PadR family transcriptional regulator [Clostridiales bacterium]